MENSGPVKICTKTYTTKKLKRSEILENMELFEIPEEFKTGDYKFYGTGSKLKNPIKPIRSEVVVEDGITYIKDGVTGNMRKVNLNRQTYVNPNNFQALMEEFHSNKVIMNIKVSDKSGNVVYEFSHNHYVFTDELTETLMKMVDKIAMSPCFRNYTFLPDMKQIALMKMVKSVKKYKVGKEAKSTNPFGYFTKFICREFIIVIKKEKKRGQQLDKFRVEKYSELMEDGCEHIVGNRHASDFDHNNDEQQE